MSAAASRWRLLAVGVGGQGVLTAARAVGEAALLGGLEVVVGQLHGMSQRGGSVQSAVLVGPGSGSFLERGAADVVLGLEPLEVLRARSSLSERTRVIVNRGRVVPWTLAQKGEPYPDVDEMIAEVRSVTPDVVVVDGPGLVAGTGGDRSLNVVMLGALASLGPLPFDADLLWRAIEAGSPPKHLETNRRAFAAGREAVAA